MTPEFNQWWDSEDIAAENPYDIAKPIYWAWEGWQAAKKCEWAELTVDEILATQFATRHIEVEFVTTTRNDLIQFARQLEIILREKNG